MTKISAILVAVVLATAPSVALGASSWCYARLGDGFCSTDSIPAHPQGYFVHVEVHGPCELFTVVDTANYITVYQSSSGWGGKEKTIGPVYSSYRAYLYGGTWPVTNITLNN
jgi:hypothetical protein